MTDAVALIRRGDPRQPVAESTIRAVALDLLARGQAVAEIIAALTTVADEMPADITPREREAAAYQSRREAMIAALIRLEQQGRGRDAVKVVARDFARDRYDLIEVESLARKLSRWRATFPDTVRATSPKSVRG
jgi:lipopolysaccharide biosynthesis protein